MKYSILAQWREEDQCYVVLPPEFAEGVLAPEADGATHAAIKKAIEEVKAALASR